MRGEEQRREREIPADLRAAAAQSAHLMAAAHRYIATGDHAAWARCFDALRADCDRLAADLTARGLGAATLPVGPWPEGDGAAAVLTRAQEVALIHAAEAQRLLFDMACRAAAYDVPRVIVLSPE